MASRHAPCDLDALALLQLDVHLRIGGHPGCKPFGQMFGDGGRVGEDADRRAEALGIFAELTLHLPDLAEDHPGMMGKRFTGFRRGDATAAAIEQDDLAEGLHVAQALAGSGKREAGIRRSVRDAAGVDDGQKQAKVCEIEAHVAMIGYFEPSDQPKAGRELPHCPQRRNCYRYAMSDLSFSFVLAVTATFFIAGIVKGVTGMGLPTVAMGVLGALTSPLTAASLLIAPSSVTNIWQLFAGPAFLPLLRRLWPMMAAIVAGTMVGSAWLASGDTDLTTRGLGAALLLYAAYALFARQLSVSARVEPWLSPVIGVATGLVTGATGVFVIPAVPYLQALGLAKDSLVQALGLSFTISTIALAAALALRGAFGMGNLALSCLAILPALAGMWVGLVLRERIAPETFRRLFLICLLLLGAEMCVVAH